MRSRSPEIGVALVGCGAIASAVHLRILRKARGVRLAGVADPDPAARARASRARVPTFDDARALFERDDVRAVVLCAPTHLHAELALAALACGKHIYLEKPIATSLADARRIVETAACAGVVAAIGFNHRFHPLHGLARELLRGGTIGTVRAVETAFCEPARAESQPAWKRTRATGGGVLLDLASHQIDLLRWFLTDEIVCAHASLEAIETEDDTARLALRTARGVTASGFFSSCAGRGDHLRFLGDEGVLHLDRYTVRFEIAHTRFDAGSVRRRRLPPAWRFAPWQVRKLVRPSFEPSYRRALEAFLDAVAGLPRELPTLVDGLRSLEVVIAAEASAREGSAVDLSGLDS